MPTGTVTFLFTDIEGSTRLWQEHPGAMRSALADHDAMVRQAIDLHGGVVVKTTGDGAHAVFADASDAVNAAVAAQLALAAFTWPLPDPLQVRMGIHSGPAELRGGDYYGTAVNRAARLMSAAHGGQIVVSLATEELIRDTGVELVDLGEHALRDVARPERMFQVAHPGLPQVFPRLASLETLGGNLPVQVTSFVGRDDELDRVLALVGDASLVTLIGPGGVGKTRLAIEAGAELLPEFRDGAWFCELAAVNDGDAMAQAVAATLGCVQRQGLSLLESVVEYAKVRQLLLLLDNCEHLLDEAGALAEAVMQSCPRATVLATSREALDVAGERVVRVPSLDAPDTSTMGEEVVRSASVQLFIDRASDAGANVAWNEAQWESIAEICRRVDGIPLAIELAAARVVSMSPGDIAAHLDERFRILTGRRRGRVERQQTLRATVEWSYQLLTQDERSVFDRLGVFAGTFDAAAAAAVAGDDDLDSWQVLDALSSLVAKSMLGAEDGIEGTTRYSMLETLRQFARDRLDELGNADRWRRRHAERYAAWALSASFGLVGPDEALWLSRLRADLDDVRAAVGWALDRTDPGERELGVSIIAGLAVAGQHHPDTGIGALAAHAVTAAETCTAEVRAPVLALAAYHEMNQGQTGRAHELASRALRDDVVGTAVDPFIAHTALGFVILGSGNYSGHFDFEDEARTALNTLDNPYAASSLLSMLACFEGMTGEVDRSRPDAARALELARQSQNVHALAMAFHATAWALQRDDPAGALAAAEQYLDLFHGNPIGSGGGLLALAGGLRARLGDPDGALQLLHEAVLVARDQGTRPQLAATVEWAINPLIKVGDAEAAATLLGALTGSPLGEVGNFPGVATRRSRLLQRVSAILGDESAEALIDVGASMTYDAIVGYALHRLDLPRTHSD